MSDNIKVAIRVRPLIQREKDADVLWEVDSDGHTLKTKDAKPYLFDRVFKQTENTDYVYAAIAAPIVAGAMEGFNGTIFAYGQTSSGKTFTMMGTDEEPGIIKQAVEEIFTSIENTPTREFLIRASYMEIYNENVADLLNDKPNKKNLEIREDKMGKVYVENLREEYIQNPDQVFNLMKIGDANRHVGSTNMNEKSSRSHSIFQVVIESKDRSSDEKDAVIVSQLNLVDLAGSEKARNTGAVGQRLVEGGYINKSLFTLGKIISQLSDGAGFVNYRDSKLTRILQNSLGGNSKTAIICNVTPASLEETHSTLRFATSAKKIVNKAIVNEVLSEEAQLKRYKKQLTELSKQLEATKKLEAVAVNEENQELKQTLSEQQEKIARLTNLICVSSKFDESKPSGTLIKQRKRRETWCPGKARTMATNHTIKSDGPSHIDLANSSLGYPRRVPNRKFLESRIAGRNSMPVESIDEEEMPDVSLSMDTSLGVFTNSLHKEFDEEVNYKKKAEEMQVELSDMQQKLQESIEISTGFAERNEKLKSYQEMAECQFKNLNARVRVLETELELKSEDLLEREKLLSAMEKEMGELKDFIDVETMMKENSFMAKQFGEDMVDELRDRIAMLEKTEKEMEQCLVETRKQVAMETDDKILLERQIADLQKENDHLDSDKQDFDTVFEIERNKHRQREQELLQQLELAYSESGANRSTTPTPDADDSERPTTPTPDSIRCKELEQQMEELKEELLQNENMQEQLIMKLQDAETKIEQLQTVQTMQHGSDTMAESQLVDDSMTVEMKQFGLMPSAAPVAQDAPLHWEMEEAKLKAENEELAQFIEELKKDLLSVQLEKTDIQEKLDKMYETTKDYSVATDETLSQVENELLQKIDLLNKQLQAAEETKAQLQEDIKCSIEATIESQEDLVTVKNEFSQVKNELLHAQVKIAELQAEQPEGKSDSPVKSPVKTLQNEQLSNELAEAKDRITQLEFELDQALEEMAQFKHKESLESNDERINELQEQLDNVMSAKAQSEEQVIELEEKLSAIQSHLENGKVMYENLQTEVNEKVDVIAELEGKLNSSSTKKGDRGLEEHLAEERKAFVDLEKKYGQLLADKKHNSDRLLSETNRDLDSQRRIQELESKRRESIAAFQQATKENLQIIDARDKQIYELKTRLQKADGECELAQHNEKRAQEQINKLKEEIRDLEDLHTRHEAQRGRQDMDPDKMADRIKKLAMSADLSQQRANKYETRIKELEAEARKTEDTAFQKNNLQRQLREVEHTLNQKQEELKSLQARFSTSHSDILELKMEIDSLKDKLDRAIYERDGAFADKDLLLEEKNNTVQQKEKLLGELQQISMQAADYKKQLSKHEDGHDNLVQRLCDEKDQLQVDYEKLQTTIKQLQAERENLLQQVEQAKAEAEGARKCLLGQEEDMDSIQGHLNSQITEMQSAHKQALVDMENKNHSYVAELEAKHESQLEQTEAKLREELSNLADQHSSALNDLKMTHSKVLEAAEAKIKDLKDELINHMAAGSDIDIESIQDKHQGELLSLESQLRDEIDELNANYESDIAVKQALHDQAMSDLESKHAETINTMKSEYEQKLLDLEGEQLRQQEEIEKGHQRELEDCITRGKDEIASARTQQAAEMKQLEEKLDTEMQELQEHLVSQAEEFKAEKVAWTAKLEDELAATSAQHSQQMKAQEHSYKEKIEAAEAKYTELLTSKACTSNKETEERIQDLVKHYEGERALIEEKYEEIIKVKTEELSEKTERTEKAKQELSEYLSMSEKLVQEINELKEEIEKKSTAVSSMSEQISVLTNRLIEKNKTIDQLQDQIQTLELQHAEDRLELELNLKEEYHQKISEVEATAQSDTMGQMELAQSEAADLKECLDMALQEKEELENKVIALESRLQRKETECIELQSNPGHAKSEDLEVLEKRIFDLQDDNKRFQNEIDRLENICDELDGENENYQNEIRQLKAKVVGGPNGGGSLEELQRLRNELDARKNEIESLKKENNGASVSSQEVAELMEKLGKEKENVEYYMKKRDQIEEINDELEEEAEQFREEIASLKSKISQLEEQSSMVDQVQDELPKTRKRLAEERLKNAQLSDELLLVADPLKKKIKELRKENSNLNERCQNLKTEVRRLKNIQPDNSVISEEKRSSDEGGSGSTLAIFKLECTNAALERENKDLKTKLEQGERALSTKKLIESELRCQLSESDKKYQRVKAYCTKHKLGDQSRSLKELLNSPKKSDHHDTGAAGGRENQADGPFSLLHSEGDERLGDCKQQ